jgi:photosynthetic reaction center cytochrome c subunit
MKPGLHLGVVGTAVLCLGAGLAGAQPVPLPKPPMAEDVFKNVQVLKGIPVDEFMSTMGIFSVALGMSCEDCHTANDSKWENFAIDNPRKRRARSMVQMMGAINKGYFGGRQVVTCYSCHRGAYHPKVTPNPATLFSGVEEPDDTIPAARDGATADQILDKYIQAVGGAQRVDALTSFIAKGTSAGYGPEAGKRPVEIYAKAPGLRTTVVHTDNGDKTSVFDGRAGWIAEPLRPVPVLALAGHILEGAKLDAELSFPLRIKQALGNWRAGLPTTIEDRDVQVVQGTSAGGALATLYFDAESGLLRRLVRYANSAVGRIPTEVDYADYREVAGVRMPFRWTVTWLDGKETYELTEFEANAAVDPARFAKPSPPVAPRK